MVRDSEQLVLARVLRWVALIATVFVVPWTSFDPINVPKLTVITLGGFISLAILGTQFRALLSESFRLPILVVLLFILDLVLVLIFAGNNFNQEFYGANGRSTGFIAYISLAGLLIAGIVSATHFTLKRFSLFLIGAGALSAVYGFFQALGADPVKWINSYSPVIGFLGNPDFQSSFIGFSSIMAFAILIRGSSNRIKAGLLVFLTLAVFVIYETKAQQGFLVLLGGVSIIVFLFMNKSKAKKLTWPLLGAGFFGIILITAGSLNKGPLASLLHKESVIYRGDYWRAGWKMTVDHPIFGVGLDSYGDWYRRSRTLEATLRRGPEIVSNAAHNVLLDFSSSGGFPLVILYLMMMALVFRAAIRVIRRNSNFDPYFSGLFAVWVAYHAQSVISLNQLGLAVWGWIISGLIIGWEIHGRSPEKVVGEANPLKRSKNSRTGNKQKVLSSTSVAIFVGLFIGSLVGIPPMMASAKFKSALESGNAGVLANSAKIYPQDGTRSVQVAFVLHRNKLDAQALPIILEATTKYPDVFDTWKVLASLSNVTQVQISEAKAQMKRLDPYNPDLK